MRIVLAFAVGLLIGMFVTGALVHAQEGQMYRGAEGQWHQHDAKWEGLWIAQDFPSCCGERDCHKAGDGEVMVERLESGAGFLVHWRQPEGVDPEPEFIPYGSPVVRPSQDGTYWACYRRMNGNDTRSTRCLFVPPLGF